jgi:DNA-binding NtrC family response regulator/ligand-binding sensor domain-containing protein
MENNVAHMPSAGLGVWEHFTMADGLPDMKIECVFEDSRGILWIGTHDRGVVRYEGDEFVAYNRRDGLTGDGVFSVVEDRQGHLWLGTDLGLTRYDGQKFERVETGEQCGFLWGRCIDREGRLWFGVDRRPGRPPAVCCWDGQRLELVNVGDKAQPQGESLHRVVCDQNGVLWAGGDKLYRSYDARSFELLPVPTGERCAIEDMLPRRETGLWIATADELWAYKTGEFELLLGDLGGLGPVSLLEAPSGGCWLATYDGRLIYSEGTDFRLIQRLNAVLRGGFCMDHVGRLWVGTYGMGLYCYDETRLRILRSGDGLPANSVDCLAAGTADAMWVGTRGGLAVCADDGVRPWAGSKGPTGKEVTALLVDSRGRLWMGLRSGWVYVSDGAGTRPLPVVPDMEGYRISSLLEDQQGRIWFGCRYGKGFGYYDDDEVRYFPADGANEYPVWIGAMAADQQGNIWLGSAAPAKWDGLCRYDGASFVKVPGVAGTPILALCTDRQGCLWVGTNDGLSRYDGIVFRHFTHDDGLLCEMVTAVAEAGDGTIWVGTEGGGVCVYDGEVFQAIQVPSEPGCNVIRAIQTDGHGHLWFGTEDGLIRYAPRRLQPRVAVTEVVANETHVPPAEIQFPTTVGRVSFSVAGYSPQDRSSYLVYRYRLQGYDGEWRQTRERQVGYPRLPPGEYQFAVQAVDRDLNYSEAVEISLSVTEDPRIAALNEALRAEATRGEFIGEGAALEEVKRQIREVAWTDLTVLVLGETGTGKGLAARALHELSERRAAPFIHVNCGAVQQGLVDSELFGHERGSFTGAVSRRLGKFELAHGGTIFLDEIGDLPLESQTRLLRVLQDRCIERVGGTHTIPVDVRVVVATNRDLVQAVRTESFRPDLYYRLNVFPILIPPLRKRREDVPLLARHFVRWFSSHLNRETPRISDESMGLLLDYDWPGNVRELEHTLQRAVLLARDGVIQPEHVALAPAGSTHQVGEDGFTIMPWEDFERQYLTRVLEHTGGVIHGRRGAASLLEVKPTTLRSRLEKLGLRRRRPGA